MDRLHSIILVRVADSQREMVGAARVAPGDAVYPFRRSLVALLGFMTPRIPAERNLIPLQRFSSGHEQQLALFLVHDDPIRDDSGG